ncbi:unnamed protein product, partial [Porites evermanni]
MHNDLVFDFIAVLQILSRGGAEGKSISLDVSQVRINPLECYDRINQCKEQAEDGYCETNYHYMMDRCPWSCRFCRRAGGDTEKCTDLSKHCSYWVSKKECTTRPDYMAQNCKRSCEMCGPESDYNLTDKETTCPLWAKAGWCQSNEDLLDKCPHSCQKYGVQGANSLDERYITVNFQNSSSVASSKVVTFEAPPPPSAAIRSHSDLDTLPPDLKEVLAKEWWDSKLLKLTQKQNGYVTHPEPRPVTLTIPRESNETASNQTLNATAQSDQKERNRNESGWVSIFFTGPIQQQELVTVPAPLPPPRAYDSLLPKLFLSGGPTWATRNSSKTTHRSPDFSTQTNQEIWKEEKEEDEDLTESGQQKEVVPVRVNSNDQQGLRVDVSSSGSGWDIVKDGAKNSEGNEGDHHLTGEHTTSTSFSFSGSEENITRKMESKQKVPEGDSMEENATLSGSGEEERTRKHVIVADRPKNGLVTEKIKIVLPENDVSGSGKIDDQEGWADSGVSLSGSGQQD